MSKFIKKMTTLLVLLGAICTLAGCGKSEVIPECPLEDGIYTADFNTDSSMFRVNEANKGKGTLTVSNGQMNIHITLVSKKIEKLYLGMAEDAQKDGAVLLEPTLDTVIYDDGTEEEVYGFDVPVPYLDQEFDLALVGKKGTWYDHKVSVTNPTVYVEEENAAPADVEPASTDQGDAAALTESTATEDGKYLVPVVLEGGSGKAKVDSPCEVVVENGNAQATITFSSPNYDFMIVAGSEFKPVNTEGNSSFLIPVVLNEDLEVQADTVAMSEPHLIDYTLKFDWAGAVLQ